MQAPGGMWALVRLAAICGLGWPIAAAAGDAPPPAAASNVVWHTDGFFTQCDGNCAVSLLVGQQTLTLMPWHWRWGNTQLIGGAISRRLVTLWRALDIEPEFGLAKRVGGEHADEAWLALYFRWTEFPWNRYIRTTVALNTGISTATDLPPGSRGANVLHYVGPEVTFALPDYSQYQLMVQLHHRSGIWIGNSIDPGWEYLAIGFRYQF
jgi:hypothetical protein